MPVWGKPAAKDAENSQTCMGIYAGTPGIPWAPKLPIPAVSIDIGSLAPLWRANASSVTYIYGQPAPKFTALTAGRNRWPGDLVQTTRMLGSYQIISRPAHRPERIHSEGHTLSVIDCDYLPDPEPIPFPPELALLIVRKAAAMAEAFEGKALDQMTSDASRALRDGVEPRRIIRQMGL